MEKRLVSASMNHPPATKAQLVLGRYLVHSLARPVSHRHQTIESGSFFGHFPQSYFRKITPSYVWLTLDCCKTNQNGASIERGRKINQWISYQSISWFRSGDAKVKLGDSVWACGRAGTVVTSAAILDLRPTPELFNLAELYKFATVRSGYSPPSNKYTSKLINIQTKGNSFIWYTNVSSNSGVMSTDYKQDVRLKIMFSTFWSSVRDTLYTSAKWKWSLLWHNMLMKRKFGVICISLRNSLSSNRPRMVLEWNL